MRRRTLGAVATSTALVLLLVATIPAAAHTNTIEATTQVSPDGTILVESVFVFEDAWLVVHRDDGGEIGRPLGHTSVAPDNLQTAVPIEIESSVWSTWDGARAVHLALHHDDGDGEFSPVDDPVLGTEETTAATRIVVEKGQGRAYVHAAGIEPLETRGNVSVRAAAMPADGFLVAHPPDEPEQVVGSTALDVGDHDSVSIRIDKPFYRQQARQFDLSISIYRYDGDGTIGDAGTPLRAGDELVSTTVTLDRIDDRTPTATTEAADDHDHEEGESHTHEPSGDGETDSPVTETAGEDGAAPGPVLSLLAITAAVLLARGLSG